MTLSSLTRIHCAAHRPALCSEGFSRDVYGVSLRALQLVFVGRRRPSDHVIRRIHLAHVRLFPGRTEHVELPDDRVVTIGAEGLVIAFPPEPSIPMPTHLKPLRCVHYETCRQTEMVDQRCTRVLCALCMNAGRRLPHVRQDELNIHVSTRKEAA